MPFNLLAQMGAPPAMATSFDPTQMAAIIGAFVVLGLMIVVGLPVWLGIRQNRHDRELQHAERMKALELGLVPPGEAVETPMTPLKLATRIGLWVPIAVVGLAWLASSSGFRGSEAWWAAGAIGVAAVVSSTILILRLPASAWSPDLSQANSLPRNQKAHVADPDAFDVAGRRG